MYKAVKEIVVQKEVLLQVDQHPVDQLLQVVEVRLPIQDPQALQAQVDQLVVHLAVDLVQVVAVDLLVVLDAEEDKNSLILKD